MKKVKRNLFLQDMQININLLIKTNIKIQSKTEKQ